MGSLSQRVALRASRLKTAKDFGTPEALQEYLSEHPLADRAKHKVDKSKAKPAKPDEKSRGKSPKPPPPAGAGSKPPKAPEAKPQGKKPPPIPEAAKKKPPQPKPEPKPQPKLQEHGHHEDESHGDDHGGKPAGRFDGWKKSLKGLKDSATKFVESAPKAVKSFLSNPEIRKASLKEAAGALKAFPKKAVDRLKETAKEEVHEFKTAAEGIKAVMSGKKMSKHQKHAFRAVATHIAIGATAAAFAATGPLVGAAVFTKNLATHVALKSVKKSLGNVHTMNEVSHIGHGIMHLFEHIASEGDSKKEVDPEDAMTSLILACVAKEIESLSDEDLTTVLNEINEDEDGEDTDEEEAQQEAEQVQPPPPKPAAPPQEKQAEPQQPTPLDDRFAALKVLRRFQA
jgi:hypothetical protein